MMSDCEEELGQEEKEKGKRDSRGCWTLQENCKKKIRGDETKKQNKTVQSILTELFIFIT